MPVSGELDAETVYFTKVNSNVKVIYSVIGRQSVNTTAFDWNDTAKEVSNEKTRVDDIRVNSLNKFSNSKGVFCFIHGNAVPQEMILQLNEVNELAIVQLPLV